jgi:hypothetical protein
MAGTEDAPEQVQLVVRVNRKQTPSFLKGDIVIGNGVGTPDGTTGNSQSESGGIGGSGGDKGST